MDALAGNNRRARNRLRIPIRCAARNHGFSIVELTVVVIIAGILLSIAVTAWDGWQDRVDHFAAVADLRALELSLYAYRDNTGAFPDTLDDAGLGGREDPWGTPYQYLNFDVGVKGKRRKDRNLVPINSDFDLYSMGKDGKSSPPLTANASKDDIVRGRDGRFLDLGEKF